MTMRNLILLIALFVASVFAVSPALARHERHSAVASQDGIEAWIRTRLTDDGRLDLKDRCQADLHKNDDHCRIIDAALLSKLLKASDSSQGVKVSDAIIQGDLDLTYINFRRYLIFENVMFLNEIFMDNSFFGKDVLFDEDRFGGGLSAHNTEFNGRLVLSHSSIYSHEVDVHGSSMRAGLSITDARITPPVNLDNSIIQNELEIDNTIFDDKVEASNLKIDGALTIKNNSQFGGFFDLEAADISRIAHISGSSFGKGIGAKWGAFKKSLLIDSGTTFDGPLDLEGTHIDDDLKIAGSKFQSPGAVAAWERIAVKGSVFIGDGTTFRGLFDMIESSVGGNIEIGNATENQTVVFSDKLNISLSTIKSSVYIHNVDFRSDASIASTQIDHHLDISGSSFKSLNLSRSTIGGDFRLWPQEGQKYHGPIVWEGRKALLDMRYAHIDAIEDEIDPDRTEDRVHRWPDHLGLDGFTFDHFGTPKNADWAERWLEKWRQDVDVADRFDPQPYEQVAGYFKRIGAQDDSDQINTLSHDYQLQSYLHQCWPQSDGGACWHLLRLGFLKYFVGYGIGYGVFWVLLPTAIFVFIGFLVLRFSSEEDRLWCFTASLNKLLPGINFNKEFADAFDNSGKLTLSNTKKAYFILHVLVGFVLAALILGAFTGLVQSR